jgi:hypothetical protein
MYKPLFDENHQLISFKTNVDPKFAKRHSSGEWDKEMTCSDCDSLIGKYEDYASLVFQGGKSGVKLETERQLGMNIYHSTGVNYSKFKLFLLSILWKASISKRDTFKNVTLADDQSEIIRQMILAGDPGPDSFYPATIFGLHSANAQHLQRIILSPHSNKGLHVFYISGFLFCYAEDPGALPENPFYLRENGSISIPGLGPEMAYKLMDEIFGIRWLNK